MNDDSNNGLGNDLKDKASELGQEAKETVEQMKEGWNEVAQGGENKKVLAGILAILLGSFGVHKFVLGYNKEGTTLLIVTAVGYITACLGVGAFLIMITGLIGLVEGIIYLTKSDNEFYQTYQVNKKPWF